MAYRRVYRKKRIGPGRKFRRAVRGKKGAVKSSRSFAKKVKAVVHRMAENKTWERVGVNTPLNGAYSGVTSVDPSCFNLLPWISQGTGQSGRIGNQIRLVKNKFTAIVNPLPYGGSATYQAPILVKYWVFSPKAFTNFTGDMGNANWKQFFQVNNADSGFYGNTLDMLQNVNTELYTVHTARSFQLNTAVSGTISVSGAVYQGTSGQYSHKFTIDLTKYVKMLRYDDDTSTRPTNKNLLIAFQTCYADGTINGTLSNNQIAEIHFIQECEYEDL